MAYDDPKEGSWTNHARDKGFFTDLQGNIRRPDGSTVQGTGGPLRDDKGIVKSPPPPSGW